MKKTLLLKNHFISLPFLLLCLCPLIWGDEPEWDIRLFKRNVRFMEIVRQTYLESIASTTTAIVPTQGTISPQGVQPQSADLTFKLGDVYCFPNPAKGQNPIFHIEVGVAEKVNLRIYDISGSQVHETSLTGTPPVINDGQGPQYAYEYVWDVSGVGSGVYVFAVMAKKGSETLKRIGKCAVIK
ncbi:MAG: T9SS type A sorting domain-containing protein [Elusimicrobia bacterium]|nr:T9SS type A sorting domain-containing protein [Elusimicrobiota bacterium]